MQKPARQAMIPKKQINMFSSSQEPESPRGNRAALRFLAEFLVFFVNQIFFLNLLVNGTSVFWRVLIPQYSLWVFGGLLVLFFAEGFFAKRYWQVIWRRSQLGRTGLVTPWRVFLFLSVPLFFVLVLSPIILRNLLVRQLGETTSATVSKLTTSSYKGGVSYQVAYTFQAAGPGERSYGGQQAVELEVWASLQIGSPLIVRYLPVFPEISYLDDDETLRRETTSVFAFSLAPLILPLLHTLVLGREFWGMKPFGIG